MSLTDHQSYNNGLIPLLNNVTHISYNTADMLVTLFTHGIRHYLNMELTHYYNTADM
jgi:acetylornithine/succinyldiaminopimelate/putrescine aminotransferase